MSRFEYTEFGKRLAFHAAPTLLGIKCASLVCLSNTQFDISFHCEYFNRRSQHMGSGLKSRVLCGCGKRALMLIYNEKQLEKRLRERDTAEFLKKQGYDINGTLSELLDTLSERVSCGGDFPHEIGLFLDYPFEDVKGFIENKGENYKLLGCWKVYGSEEDARRKFAAYEKCRNFLCNKLNEGTDLYKVLKIS